MMTKIVLLDKDEGLIMKICRVSTSGIAVARIRLSGLNLKKDGRLLNVPLYLVDWLPKFISLALHS